jgi:hypothetical protein
MIKNRKNLFFKYTKIARREKKITVGSGDS